MVNFRKQVHLSLLSSGLSLLSSGLQMVWKWTGFVALLKKKMPHTTFIQTTFTGNKEWTDPKSYSYHLNMEKTKNAPSSFFFWETLHEKKNRKRKDFLSVRCRIFRCCGYKQISYCLKTTKTFLNVKTAETYSRFAFGQHWYNRRNIEINLFMATLSEIINFTDYPSDYLTAASGQLISAVIKVKYIGYSLMSSWHDLDQQLSSVSPQLNICKRRCSERK